MMRDLLIVNYDSYEVFSDLLDFLYSGTIAPRETNFLQLLHLAVSFQIDLLKHYCEEFLRSNLHLGNFLSTYFLSRKYNLKSLEEFIVSFIQANLSDVVKQIEFLTLPADRFNAILSKGYMVDLKPEIKLFLIISWVGYEVRDRECFLIQLLRHIDWSIVASDFLLEISRTENFFTTHESSLYLLLQTLYSSGISLGPYTDHFPSLRQTYSHMLSDIVKAGLIDSYEEEFYPVTASGVCTKFLRSDACVGTDAYYQSTTEVDKTWEELRSVVFSPPTQQTAAFERQINEVEKENKMFYQNQSMMQQQNQAVETFLGTEESKSSKRKGKPRKMVLTEASGKVQGGPTESSGKVSPLKGKRNLSHLEEKKGEVTSPKKRPRTVGRRRRRRTVKCEPESPEESEEAASEEEEEEEDEDQEKEKNESDNDEDNDDDDQDEESGDEERDEEEKVNEGEEDDDDEEEEDTENEESEGEEEYKRNAQAKTSSRAEGPDFIDESEDEWVPEEDVKKDTRMKTIRRSSRPPKPSRLVQKKKKTKKSPKSSKKNLNKELFPCSLCDYETDQQSRLETHMKRIHECHMTYKCMLCDFSTKWSKAFTEHIKDIHFDGPPFKCTECEFSAKKLHMLMSHRFKHGEDRIHACDFCDQRFKTRNNALAHIKTHSGKCI